VITQRPSGATDAPIDSAYELGKCLRDLLGLLALPALTAGRDARVVCELALSSLEAVLPIDLAYFAHEPGTAGCMIEQLRLGGEDASQRLDELRDRIDEALVSSLDELTIEPFGTLRTFVARLGFYGQQGRMLLGSRDASFPRPTHVILIQAAATLSSAGLEHARLMRESAETRARSGALR
jgi:hypothetical protein